MADERTVGIGVEGPGRPPTHVEAEGTAPASVEPATISAQQQMPRIHRRVIKALVEGVGDLPQVDAVVAGVLADVPDGAHAISLAIPDFQRLVNGLSALLCPGDPMGAGQRRAGHAFAEGWSRHPCGRVFVDGLRAFPLARAVVRLADGMRFGAEGLELDAVLLGAHHMRLTLRGNSSPNLQFFCGCMEGMLGVLGATGVEAVPEPGPGGSHRLLIAWEPPS